MCVTVGVSGVDADVGFDVGKVCGDRAEVVYRCLCVDCAMMVAYALDQLYNSCPANRR